MRVTGVAKWVNWKKLVIITNNKGFLWLFGNKISYLEKADFLILGMVLILLFKPNNECHFVKVKEK